MEQKQTKIVYPTFCDYPKKVPWPEAKDGAQDGLLYSQGLDLVEFLLSNIIVL